jgi:hypothetical protein
VPITPALPTIRIPPLGQVRINNESSDSEHSDDGKYWASSGNDLNEEDLSEFVAYNDNDDDDNEDDIWHDIQQMLSESELDDSLDMPSSSND